MFGRPADWAVCQAARARLEEARADAAAAYAAYEAAADPRSCLVERD